MANIPQRGQPAPIPSAASQSLSARRNFYAGPPAAPAPGGCKCNVPPAAPCCEACRYGAPCGTKLGEPWTPETPPTVPPLVPGHRALTAQRVAPRVPTPITAYPVAETMANLAALGAAPALAPLTAYPMPTWYPPGSIRLPTAWTPAQAAANRDIAAANPAGNPTVCWYQKIEHHGGQGAGEQGKFLLICESPTGAGVAATVTKKCFVSVSPDHPPIETTCFEDL